MPRGEIKMTTTITNVTIDRVLGRNGYIEFKASDILENGGKFEFRTQEIKNLPVNEGVKYQAPAVQSAWSKVDTVKNEIRLIKGDKSIPKAKIESRINKLIHDKTSSEIERRTLEMMIKGADNFTVPVINETKITITTIDNGDGTFTSHASFEKLYTDKDGDICTTQFKKVLFMDKVGKGKIRITQEEVFNATGIEKKAQLKMASDIISILNEWNDIKLENSGRFELAFASFQESVEKKIAESCRFMELYANGQI